MIGSGGAAVSVSGAAACSADSVTGPGPGGVRLSIASQKLKFLGFSDRPSGVDVDVDSTTGPDLPHPPNDWRLASAGSGKAGGGAPLSSPAPSCPASSSGDQSPSGTNSVFFLRVSFSLFANLFALWVPQMWL